MRWRRCGGCRGRAGPYAPNADRWDRPVPVVFAPVFCGIVRPRWASAPTVSAGVERPSSAAPASGGRPEAAPLKGRPPVRGPKAGQARHRALTTGPMRPDGEHPTATGATGPSTAPRTRRVRRCASEVPSSPALRCGCCPVTGPRKGRRRGRRARRAHRTPSGPCGRCPIGRSARHTVGAAVRPGAGWAMTSIALRCGCCPVTGPRKGRRRGRHARRAHRTPAGPCGGCPIGRSARYAVGAAVRPGAGWAMASMEVSAAGASVSGRSKGVRPRAGRLSGIWSRARNEPGPWRPRWTGGRSSTPPV